MAEWIVEAETLADLVNGRWTANTKKIVRCKDCIHLEILNSSIYYARCGWHGRLFESFGGRADTRTWFCADGERRETE